MTDDTVTSEGTRLIKAWEVAKRDVERAKSALNSAECALSNATSALTKWMLPEDAKPGEKICVWHLDSLIQVEVPPLPRKPEPGCVGEGPRDPVVTIRKRGREYALHRAA